MVAPTFLVIVIGLLVVLTGIVVAGIAIARNPQSLQRNNPNLHPCRDCGQFISIRATMCPHCGAPIKGAM